MTSVLGADSELIAGWGVAAVFAVAVVIYVWAKRSAERDSERRRQDRRNRTDER